MGNAHHEQLTLSLQEAAARFISEHANRTTLITVTRAILSPKEDRIIFYVSIFPESGEQPALGFLMRNRGTCREYLKEHLALGRIPHVEFLLDEGEKKRQRVDELLRS